MRMKPLRGAFIASPIGLVQYLERVPFHHELCRVLKDDKIIRLRVDELSLPIIDTKDYEKIADEKYRGD